MSSTKNSPDTTPGEDSGAHRRTPQGLAARAHSLLSRWNGIHLIASMFVGGAVIIYLLAGKGAPSSALAQQEA